MARRIVLGKVGSEFLFRVSQPGIDAATAGLDDLIFDADNIPARVSASGLATVSGTSHPTTESTNDVAHGLGYRPALVIGVAQSTYTDPLQPAENGKWFVRTYEPIVGVSAFEAVQELKTGWCTPWYWQGDDSAGGFQSAGWRLAFNSTNVTIINRSANAIRVRWAALDF